MLDDKLQDVADEIFKLELAKDQLQDLGVVLYEVREELEKLQIYLQENGISTNKLQEFETYLDEIVYAHSQINKAFLLIEDVDLNEDVIAGLQEFIQENLEVLEETLVED